MPILINPSNKHQELKQVDIEINNLYKKHMKTDHL